MFNFEGSCFRSTCLICFYRYDHHKVLCKPYVPYSRVYSKRVFDGLFITNVFIPIFFQIKEVIRPLLNISLPYYLPDVSQFEVQKYQLIDVYVGHLVKFFELSKRIFKILYRFCKLLEKSVLKFSLDIKTLSVVLLLSISV